MKIEIYEIEEPLRLLDTEGIWHVEIRAGQGIAVNDSAGHFNHYASGNVVVFKTSHYVDAERAGFAGYVGQAIEIPEAVLVEAAVAIRAGHVPIRGDGDE